MESLGGCPGRGLGATCPVSQRLPSPRPTWAFSAGLAGSWEGRHAPSSGPGGGAGLAVLGAAEGPHLFANLSRFGSANLHSCTQDLALESSPQALGGWYGEWGGPDGGRGAKCLGGVCAQQAVPWVSALRTPSLEDVHPGAPPVFLNRIVSFCVIVQWTGSSPLCFGAAPCSEVCWPCLPHPAGGLRALLRPEGAPPAVFPFVRLLRLRARPVSPPPTFVVSAVRAVRVRAKSTSVSRGRPWSSSCCVWRSGPSQCSSQSRSFQFR